MKSTKGPWSRASLQLKIFLYAVVLVVGLVGSVLLFSYQRANRLAQESLDQALASTRNLYENFEKDRLSKAELVNSVVAESPILKAVVSEGDAATVLDSAGDMVKQVGSDFMIVTDAHGLLLARTDQPGRKGEDLSAIPLVRLALEGERGSGVWREGTKLYHAVAVPLAATGNILGSVTSGYEIGDHLASDIKKFTRCDVVFFAGSGAGLQLAGSTLAESASTFRDWMTTQDMSGRVPLMPVLAGEKYQSVVAPLKTEGGESVGYFVALRSRDRELQSFRAFQGSVLLVGGIMFLVAIGASFLVARGITRPIKSLVAVTDRVREGDYASDVEVETEDEIGALARSFRALVGELREKSLMEKYISKSAAEMIQKTDFGAAEGTSVRKDVTVLFSDLRAFTRMAREARPEAMLSGLNQALSREAELVERYGGNVDKFVGDRMMAVFDGRDMVLAAVRCANAIQEQLSQDGGGKVSFRASIGVSTGEAVSGNVGSTDRLDYTLLGRVVHVAGRLCDEAIPGDVLLSSDTYDSVKDQVPAEPLAPMKVYGIEEPVPVYLVSGGTIRQSPVDVTSAETHVTRMRTGTLRGVTAPTAPQTPAPPVPLALIKPGYVLGSRYVIERVLGTGGMGMVFQALDRELDESVALKVLRPEIVSMDPTILDRFKKEVRLARKITHRNVLRTYDFGDLEGVKFISMEYVQGYTLKQLIKKKGALPTGVGLRIAKQTCAALAAAHEQGVVHRDVKPQNIMLTPTSEIKIMDFGIARPAADRGITTTGLVIGTPDYMSPEQAQGLPVDHRSDIYSAGIVFYELFTGRLPFSGDSAISIAMKHVQDVPAPPRKVRPEIPAELEAVILRTLEKDPARRYQKISDLHADLARVSA